MTDDDIVNQAKELAKHEQQLQQATRDIKIIYKAIDGVPQRIENINKSINYLTNTLNDFISELRKECPTRDFCLLTHKQMDEKHKTDITNLTDKTDELNKDYSRLKWGIITGLSIIVYDFLRGAVK